MAKKLPYKHVAEELGTRLQSEMDVGAHPTMLSGRNESRECNRTVVELVTTLACHASSASSSLAGPAAKRQDNDSRPSLGRQRTTVVTVVPV